MQIELEQTEVQLKDTNIIFYYRFMSGRYYTNPTIWLVSRAGIFFLINVSVKPVYLICLTSVFYTIYSLKKLFRLWRIFP